MAKVQIKFEKVSSLGEKKPQGFCLAVLYYNPFPSREGLVETSRFRLGNRAGSCGWQGCGRSPRGWLRQSCRTREGQYRQG